MADAPEPYIWDGLTAEASEAQRHFLRVDTQTYLDPNSGDPIGVLVLPADPPGGDQTAIAVARKGDANPRLVLTSGGAVLSGDGTSPAVPGGGLTLPTGSGFGGGYVGVGVSIDGGQPITGGEDSVTFDTAYLDPASSDGTPLTDQVDQDGYQFTTAGLYVEDAGFYGFLFSVQLDSPLAFDAVVIVAGSVALALLFPAGTETLLMPFAWLLGDDAAFAVAIKGNIAETATVTQASIAAARVASSS